MAGKRKKAPIPKKGRVQNVRKALTEELHNYYNGSRVSVKARLGRYLYKVGFFVEVELRIAVKKAGLYARKVWEVIQLVLDKAAALLALVLDRLKRDISAPAARMKSAFHNLRALVREEKQQGPLHVLKLIGSYIFSGFKKYSYLLHDGAEWLVPVGALVVLLITANTVLHYDYALAVEYNGQLVGYVANDSVYEAANKQVQSRIIYAEADQQAWQMQPVFNVAVVNTSSLETEDQLADSILQTSGEEISEATGLYVDGVFYGATKEPEKLQADLDATLAPYKVDDPSYSVGFVNDVQVKEGIYLTSSVVSDYNDIHKLFGSEVQGEKYYTLVAGDSPSLIASKNDITLNELYAMNPTLENSNMYPGDTVLVGRSKAFLQVKQLQQLVQDEEVAYQTIRTQTADLVSGTTKTVTKGSKGLNRVTYQITYIDGVQVSREAINTEIITPVVNEEVLVGTKIPSGGGGLGTGTMAFPVGSGWGISRGFSSSHNGCDIRAPYGTPIYAADSGVVIKVAYTNRGYGIYCMIDHGNGIQTLYGHTSGIYVSVGQTVTKGQVIGQVGSTGNSTGNHCHFEVIYNGVRVNTRPYIGY